MRGTIDPFYNESFSFKVPQEELENASLVFTGNCAGGISSAGSWLALRWTEQQLWVCRRLLVPPYKGCPSLGARGELN